MTLTREDSMVWIMNHNVSNISLTNQGTGLALTEAGRRIVQ